MRDIMGGVAAVVSVLLFSIILGDSANAGPLVVAGSPGYDEANGNGMTGLQAYGVTNTGIAVGVSTKYVSGVEKGLRAVRWNASGTAATELGNLGTDSSGVTETSVRAINDSGLAVGYAYVGDGFYGYRAVRWDASGTAATALGNLGTQYGYTESAAYAINSVGTVVGFVRKFVNGADLGYRPVRWNAGGTAASELGYFGANYSGYAEPTDINDEGTAVGWAPKVEGNSYLGIRAVRWDPTGTAATELDNLGTDNSGVTSSSATAINAAGTIVGLANKYVNGANLGPRAVRWDASGTAATELDNLGTDGSGVTFSRASAINAAGTIVGQARKYVGGSNQGNHAVRWDASGTAVTELGNLGTDSSGRTETAALAMNDAGTVVGLAYRYVSGEYVDHHAVIWLPDASVIDLNDLGVASVPPDGVWTLTVARAISADGYVAGDGTFDPDGDGPLASYDRLWVTQVGLGGSWTNTSGGTWGRGPNWSTGTPAMQVGDATFDLDAAYAVALDRDELTKTIALDAGTVTIDFAGHSLGTESGLNIAEGATLKGTGSLLGNVFNHGTLAPGTSPGTLDIDGDTLFGGSSVLEIELAGLDAYDVVNVSGNVVVEPDAMLNLSLLDGYLPSPGDLFTVMTFGSIDGQFNIVGLDTAGAPLEAVYTSTRLELRAVPEPSTLVLLVLGVLVLLAQGTSHRSRVR